MSFTAQSFREVFSSYSETKFLEELHERILYASHEIIDVRLEGLRSLKDFIKHNRQNINAAVVSKEKVDRSIIQVNIILEYFIFEVFFVTQFDRKFIYRTDFVY